VVDGSVKVAQAAVIGQVLDDVPDDLLPHGLLAANADGGTIADPVDSGLVDPGRDIEGDRGDGGGGGGKRVVGVEAVLIGQAGVFEPGVLRRLGERILAHLDPDLADRRLRERLDRQERQARARCGFTLSPDGVGGVRLHGRVDTEAAAIITAALSPLCAPATGAAGADLRSPAGRRADDEVIDPTR
jgi:hypothetical protein